MKVIQPNSLLYEAAEVLGPVREEAVVIGAVGLQVALADVPVNVTPTRDVDLVVSAQRTQAVVNHLLENDLVPSEAPHERGFTWVRNELKIQLVRPFHPFPKGAAAKLPVNPTLTIAQDPVHRHEVAFVDDPGTPRFWVVNSACLLALKERAFGRTRADGDEVRRDYHDVLALIRYVPDDVVECYGRAKHEVRIRVQAGTRILGEDGEGTMLAANEMVSLGHAQTQREAEAIVLREARQFSRRLSDTEGSAS